KKKGLLRWKIMGIVSLVISVILLIILIAYVINRNGSNINMKDSGYMTSITLKSNNINLNGKIEYEFKVASFLVGKEDKIGLYRVGMINFNNPVMYKPTKGKYADSDSFNLEDIKNMNSGNYELKYILS